MGDIGSWDESRLRAFIQSEIRNAPQTPDKTGSPPTTLEKFATADLPVGTILMWAGFPGHDGGSGPGQDPNGWFICDGRQLKRAEYPALSQVCLLAYGNRTGDATDADSFRIPDFRSSVPVGQDHYISGGGVGASFSPGEDTDYWLKFTAISGFSDNFRTLGVSFIIKH